MEPVLDKARSDDASHCAALSISQTSGTTSILQQRGQVVLSQFSSSSGTLQQRRARRSNQHSLERSNDSAARLSTCGDCRDGQFGDDLRKDTTDSEHRSDVRTDWDSPAPLASLVIPAQRVGDEPGTAASAITASCLDDGDDTLLDVFRLLDRDHDGYLTIADLRALCNVVLEIELTPVLWDEWLLGVPHSKQGKISMGEVRLRARPLSSPRRWSPCSCVCAPQFKQFTADLLVEQETSKHSVLQGAVAIWSKQADPELAALPTARLCTLMRAILGAEFDVAEASAVLTRAAKGGPLSAATLAALSSDLPLGV